MQKESIILRQIRAGESAHIRVPRAQWKKLWDWCLRHSEINGVNVTILRSSDYGPLKHQVYRRMGRAVPEIRVRPRYDYINRRCNVIAYSDIRWSYVY